ncbi:nuclear transport factor 2 family protein [Opitutaceae bacterium]|nr:nuclear transport factor 2 family protein [Opitutaceae bacterium]
MKHSLLSIIAFSLCALSASAAHHATGHDKMNSEQLAAVKAADAERMAATIAGDRARLEAILSDELRYAHSSGNVDTKESMIETLTSGTISYESFDYQERKFLSIGSDGVQMSGRVIIHAAVRGKPVEVDLNFLSVWRKEHGHWRFLGWQSCSNPKPDSD